ncbi:MAG: hypothetical protein AB7V25_07455 [Mangrovibacterium sp.]
MNLQINLLSDEQQKALEQLVRGASREQLVWLSGYFQGLTARDAQTDETPVAVPGVLPQAALASRAA